MTCLACSSWWRGVTLSKSGAAEMGEVKWMKKWKIGEEEDEVAEDRGEG